MARTRPRSRASASAELNWWLEVFLTRASWVVNCRCGTGDEALAGGSFEVLFEREREVFRRIGKSQKTRRIGGDLHFSVKTIETYRDRIREKLGLAGTELARYALQWAMETSRVCKFGTTEAEEHEGFLVILVPSYFL